MAHDAQHYHSQQFEHIMATIFTCRGIIKYNLTLAPEQKDELLGDIDTSLEALRSLLITPPLPAPEDTPVHPQADMPTSSETDALAPEKAQSEVAIERQTLESLYRMYHSYMDEKQNVNVYTFMKRFNEVASAISEIRQGTLKAAASPPLRDMLERALQQLQAFVSDMYFIFMEFIRVLSDVLQQNAVYLSTEELSVSSVPPATMTHPLQEQKSSEHDLSILLQTYMTHQRLDRLKGDFSGRVREVTTFLNFLKQNVVDTTNGREELTVRLNNATNLLEDMARLLGEYEKAASALL